MWWVLWKRYTSRRTSGSHAACDTRVSCSLRHVKNPKCSLEFSPVCDTSRHIRRINRNLDNRLFVDSAEALDGSPKLGSWNLLSAWHLASQETCVLQLERCVTENLHGESGQSKCVLSQILRSVAAVSPSVRGYQHIVVRALIETTTFV